MRWIVTGSESSGKTSLAHALADELDLILVPEYARLYIDGLDRPYISDDLDVIAHQQVEEWNLCYDKTPIFDTDILTTIIWYLDKFGKCPGYMLNHWLGQQRSFYLLCKPDFPWIPDPQRENPHDRDRIFAMYFHFLNAYGKTFKIVSGPENDRIRSIMKFINKIER